MRGREALGIGALPAAETGRYSVVKVEDADVDGLGETRPHCQRFSFTRDDEHDWYLARALTPPKRCRACRGRSLWGIPTDPCALAASRCTTLNGRGRGTSNTGHRHKEWKQVTIHQKMATPVRLAHPPITEALVDLRTERKVPFDPLSLDPLWPQVHERFPLSEKRNSVRLAARLGQPSNVKAEDLGFYGFVLKTADQSRVAQLRIDGFTFSQLAGYTSADDLLSEAMDLWRRFIALSRPDKVVRVALRYINRLSLSLSEGDDLSRFLRAPVQVPAGGPQAVSEFLTRTVIPIEDDGATSAIVTQRLEPRAPEHVTPFVFDVDVFTTRDCDMDPASLSTVFTQLRETKNQLFFSYLTDEALEKYR